MGWRANPQVLWEGIEQTGLDGANELCETATAMQVSLNPEIQRVAEFMQREIPAERLIEVASGLATLAPVLWGHFRTPNMNGVILELKPPTLSCAKRSVASESPLVAGYVADGSARAEYGLPLSQFRGRIRDTDKSQDRVPECPGD